MQWFSTPPSVCVHTHVHVCVHVQVSCVPGLCEVCHNPLGDTETLCVSGRVCYLSHPWVKVVLFSEDGWLSAQDHFLGTDALHLESFKNTWKYTWVKLKFRKNTWECLRISYCVSAFLIVRWFVLTSFRFTWGLWTLHTRKGWNSNCYPLGEDWLCFLALSPGSTCGGFRVQTQNLASLLTMETVHQGWGWGKLVVSLCEMILDDVHPHFRKEGFSGHTGPAPCCVARCNM